MLVEKSKKLSYLNNLFQHWIIPGISNKSYQIQWTSTINMIQSTLKLRTWIFIRRTRRDCWKVIEAELERKGGEIVYELLLEIQSKLLSAYFNAHHWREKYDSMSASRRRFFSFIQDWIYLKNCRELFLIYFWCQLFNKQVVCCAVFPRCRYWTKTPLSFF